MCLDITCLLLLRGGHLLNTSSPSVTTSFSQLLKSFSGCWLVNQLVVKVVFISLQVAAISPPPRLQLTNCWRQGRSKSAAARHHSAAPRSSDLTCAAHRALLANWEKNRNKHIDLNKFGTVQYCSSLANWEKKIPTHRTQQILQQAAPYLCCSSQIAGKLREKIQTHRNKQILDNTRFCTATTTENRILSQAPQRFLCCRKKTAKTQSWQTV